MATKTVTLQDLITANLIRANDVIYNIAHNRITRRQDRLYARVLPDGTLTILGGQVIEEGTIFRTLNEFMRNHLNAKILRGETQRLTLVANIWDWTYREDGVRLKTLRDMYVAGDCKAPPLTISPMPLAAPELPAFAGEDALAATQAIDTLAEILGKYYPGREELLGAQE
jgi:hypothetical protein